MRELSDYTDKVLIQIWNAILPSQLYSLIAVGGYGRGTLHPFSDIDILILSPEAPEDKQVSSIEHFIRALWDVGLEVGHSVRTVAECLEEGNADITVLTTVLESRPLSGSQILYDNFHSTLLKNIDIHHFISEKRREQKYRHNRAKDTAFSLEPNVKDCPGGLRDLQTIIWIAKCCSFGATWSELFSQGIITKKEFVQISRHQRFLDRIRINLHYHAGRRTDRLTFDYQTFIAEKFGLKDDPAKRASEKLMKRFYRAVRSVQLLNKIIIQNLTERVLSSKTAIKHSIDSNFQITDDLLEIKSPDLFRKKPELLLEIFRTWQKNHHRVNELSVETMRAIWHASSIKISFSRQKIEFRKVFIDIIRDERIVTHTLRRMNEHGILGLYIPSFGKVVGQMQHDLFHVYTVDEHILIVIRNLRRFAIPQMAHEFPLCSELMSSFAKPELLYLSALFHDIAKGRGGDHSELGTIDAKRFCIAHNLEAEDTSLVVWLVKNHLLMSSFSQKEDFENEIILQIFIEKVKNEYRLTALYLLTVADIRGTSDKVWNSWKAKLLENLFHLTRGQFAKKDKRQSSQIVMTDKKKNIINHLSSHGVNYISYKNIWDKLDFTYFSRFDQSEIIWHTKNLLNCNEDAIPLIKVKVDQDTDGIDVFIYAHDKKELFSKICGFFYHINLEIVGAKVYTSNSGYALDSFKLLQLEEIPNSKIEDIEIALRDSILKNKDYPLTGRSRISSQQKYLPIIPKVEFRPDENGSHHYLDIISSDKPGLLYKIATVLATKNVTIQTAKINTLGHRAEDSFLVKGDVFGDLKNIAQLESEILDLL